MPKEDEPVSFCQLYMIDTDEAMSLRKEKLPEVRDLVKYLFIFIFKVPAHIVEVFEDYLRENNEYAQSFSMMKDEIEKEKKEAQKAKRPERIEITF